MDNIKFLIESCGGKMEDIVKAVIYMKDIKHRKEINQVYAGYFTPGTEPVKTSVQAPSPVPGIEVEIEVTAVSRHNRKIKELNTIEDILLGYKAKERESKNSSKKYLSLKEVKKKTFR